MTGQNRDPPSGTARYLIGPGVEFAHPCQPPTPNHHPSTHTHQKIFECLLSACRLEQERAAREAQLQQMQTAMEQERAERESQMQQIQASMQSAKESQNSEITALRQQQLEQHTAVLRSIEALTRQQATLNICAHTHSHHQSVMAHEGVLPCVRSMCACTHKAPARAPGKQPKNPKKKP